MKRVGRCLVGFIISLGSFGVAASACPECRARIESEIYSRDFAANLFVIVLPILVLVTIGVGLYYSEELTSNIKRGITRWRTIGGAAR
jgi:hypothetical protein